MWIDLGPLKRNRDYRLLYFGQYVSFFGTMVTHVALPYQVYQLTQSSTWVGMIGIVQLAPILFTSFYGGALADSMDRKKLLLFSEVWLAAGALVLLFNAASATPSLAILFLAAAWMSALNGIHRPAYQSLLQNIVPKHEMLTVSSLNSIAGTIGMIGGPALGGVILARFGLVFTYAADLVSFVFCILMVRTMERTSVPDRGDGPNWQKIKEGWKYAMSRQDLIGTYLVDIIAMAFAMPMALFPALSEKLGGAHALGALYAAPSIGAFFAALISNPLKKRVRQGAWIICASALWGAFIVAFGFTRSLIPGVICLALAGAADMVSGIFRSTIWNQTIPSHLRGRLAGIEMLSYLSGPHLGNFVAGVVAGWVGTHSAVILGGFLCVISMLVCILLFPRFWAYRAPSN